MWSTGRGWRHAGVDNYAYVVHVKARVGDRAVRLQAEAHPEVADGVAGVKEDAHFHPVGGHDPAGGKHHRPGTAVADFDAGKVVAAFGLQPLPPGEQQCAGLTAAQVNDRRGEIAVLVIPIVAG